MSAALFALLSWRAGSIEAGGTYRMGYLNRLSGFGKAQAALLETIEKSNLSRAQDVAAIREGIRAARLQMKGLDFWMRYLEPLAYKSVNGPLPVEWETEVFEKFEKPYRRQGAGLTLAWNYLGEEGAAKDSLLALVQATQHALEVYGADSITAQLNSYSVFYLCNRLYLLNLATIYTSGFECPDGEQVIPELRSMMIDVDGIYTAFNRSFPAQALSEAYLNKYEAALRFVAAQPAGFEAFDHFTFIRDFVNPLYGLNQKQMLENRVSSKSLLDYSLNKEASSIFGKALYTGQSDKGIFRRVQDAGVLAEIDRVGKLLFYDPILSGNNERACASCHKPAQFFTDTAVRTAFHFNHSKLLPRNTPTLVGALYNHLVMLDGKHYNLQHQSMGVITNAVEMSGGDSAAILKKVLSCKDYKKAFGRLLRFTPQESEITMEHIASALTFYYSKFSRHDAPFDDAMNAGRHPEPAVVAGFNIFMGKAQCGTCHFAPQFNGVKPPYVGSEFEVLGVPADNRYASLSADKGRGDVHPAPEMHHAFRTGTVRNAARTAPYMHNGALGTLAELIDFYDGGGGAGHGLEVPNQTLSADSLHLTPGEKKALTAFIYSLNERVPTERPPTALPRSSNRKWNTRKVGGSY